MAPRPKKRNVKQASKLLEALNFVGTITKPIGPVNETHILLGYQWAVAFNGIVTAAHKIEEELTAAPNAKLIIEALNKCDENYSITQLENHKLSIKSNKFKATVPCIDPVLIYVKAPDDPVANIDDRLKTALQTVGVLANENAQQVLLASVLINGTTVISTDRLMILECFHGIELPTAEYNLTIPKAAIDVLSKINKKLTKFGFSSSTATFWYEDDSWIKTQLYADKWPDVTKILNLKSNQQTFPADFWEGLAAVAPFSENGLVYFDAGAMHSHAQPVAGASFEIAGLPKGPVFSIRQLGLLKGLAESVDFNAQGPFSGSTGMLIFEGRNVRGAIAGRE